MGVITWTSDKAFGHIKPDINIINFYLGRVFANITGYKVFAHITGYKGHHSRDWLRQNDISNERCLFTLGVSPHEYQRNGRAIAINWLLESDLADPESLETYYSDRLKALANFPSSSLNNILQSQWYVDLWTRSGVFNYPQVKLDLDIDPLLASVIDQYEQKIESIEEYKRWIKIKQKSPYFAINEAEKNSLKQQMLEALRQKPTAFFSNLSYSELINLIDECEQFLPDNFWSRTLAELSVMMKPQELIQITEKLTDLDRQKDYINAVFSGRTIAVDIESDGKQIYQMGWYINGQRSLESDNVALSNIRKILEKIETHANRQPLQWLVGHNIIAWDLPILRQFYSNFFQNIPVWDTLLISWLLEPWKKSHALTTSDKAHQADYDAEATFQLFQQQLPYLPQKFRESQIEQATNPLQCLYESGESIERLGDLKYPSLSANFAQSPRLIVVSKWRLWSEFAWRPKVIHAYSDAQILSPDKLDEAVVNHPDNAGLMAIACVVRDAANYQIQVTLAMLPAWLKEQVVQILPNCIDNDLVPDLRDSGDYIQVTTYSAYRNDIAQFPNTENIQLIHAEESYLELIPQSLSLSITDVNKLNLPVSKLPTRDEFSTNSLFAQSLFQLIDEASLLQLVRQDELPKFRYWLEYNPVALQETNHPCWWLHRFWKQLPSLLTIQETSSNSNDQAIATLPRWQATGTSYNRLAEEAIPPTSGNRLRYWEATLLRLFALAAVYSDETTIVLLATHSREVEAITHVLANLGQTYRVSSSVLRVLETLHRRGMRLAVDTVNNAHLWLEASETLSYPVQLVIESLPLYQWWICLNSQAITEDLSIQPEENLEQEHEADEDESNSDDDMDGADPEILDSFTQYESSSVPPRQPIPVRLSESDVLNCLDYYLRPWLNGLLQCETVKSVPIILDSRLDSVRLNRRNDLVRQDIPISPPTEAEETRLIEALRDGLGELERQIAPTDYESYRAFLQANWDYPDFRENTQKPAIEAIIPNNQDVLVRLPTGEGKSVLFQVPALLRGFHTQRLTLVITPLRALMADQVKSLWAKGFLQSVDYLSGDRDSWVMDEVYQGIVDNRIKLLFVAPERFRVKRFREALQRRYDIDNGFEYVVIDEAHCISQWGFEFRPDYLYVMKEIRRCYSNTHLLMFSATVTEAVRSELEREAGIAEGERAYVARPETMRHPIQPFIHLGAENVGTSIFGKDPDALISNRIGYIEEAIKKANPKISSIIIFVTRKNHAEILCRLLKERQEVDATVEYFHAGLEAETRLEIYEAFLERQIQVLICTKAFGMGMDIPHIHWCIHLAPPPYLEDYLQEVGRIGRDRLLREEAGLDRLEGKLLYALADFDKNHAQIKESRITPPMLIKLWNSIRDASRPLAQTNQQVCIIPVDQFDDLTENALRSHLFWLERCERIEIKGYLAGLLKIQINRAQLEKDANKSSDIGLLAQALLEIYSQSPSDSQILSESPENIPRESSGFLDNLFGFAKDFLGFLFGSKSNSTRVDSAIVKAQQGSEAKSSQTIQELDEAEIKIDSLWQKSDLPRLDDVYHALYQLNRSGSIKILREIEFEEGKYNNLQAQMWTWLDKVLEFLLVSSNDVNRSISIEMMLASINKAVLEKEEGQNITQRRMQSSQRRVVRSAIKLCNDSSLRIRETVDKENNIIWQYTLSRERKQIIEKRLKNIQYLASEIAKKLATESSLSLAKLLECCQTSISIRDLKAALRLLSNLGLYRNQKKLTTYSYIVAVHKIDKNLVSPGAEGILESDCEMYECLARVNKMAEFRSFATELYALLPDSMKSAYIDKYFSADSPEELQKVIEKSVGEIEEETLQRNADLLNLLTRVRQEAFTKEIEKLSAEQLLVCQFPYNKNLLVNAGPGAGKTHVLMMRCADLIYRQGIQPREILVLAFNRAVVYEIKKRISRLFTELGYGSYVQRLQVYTFHSFALKNLDSDLKSLEDSLHEFALKMAENSDFREQVASQYRAILVDEFQDMNEDFYSVINSLYKASGAGVMVIGDDDQDILLWNRLKNQQLWLADFGQARLHAHQYFDDFQTNFNAEYLNLTFNYRSAISIVERSQSYTNKITNRLQRRLKSDVKLSAFRNDTGSVYSIISNLEEIVKALLDDENSKHQKSIAVLCRTNAQASEIYENFRENGFQSLKIQRSDDLKLSQIREIAEWLDICENYQQNNGEISLSNQLYLQLIKQYNQYNLADHVKGKAQIEELWNATLIENSNNSILSQHIEFIKDLKTSDFERVVNQVSSSNYNITISTINKVKGLEFDVVFVTSSQARFPLTNNPNSGIKLRDFAAEEARLYYVALTRAKNTLYFSWGDREKSWKDLNQYTSVNQNRVFLEGIPDEVFISWPGFSIEYRFGSNLRVQDLQNYIKSQVKVNDLVRVNQRTICHGKDNTRIAILSKDFSGNSNSKLRVSNVYRYPVDLQRINENILNKIAPKIREQGWLYTVLLTGRLT
ncbi:UvrD-helicase domain-containing protein [Synechocystis sp. LKSZ1]|uniref:UvrD-helicase domain-containing protein n=1 Tax=Synechocystis sp. LKSZ1 TaxID=3144951 RepID=UPI00336C2882